jgi:NAD(P)H-dependent FMN reductase
LTILQNHDPATYVRADGLRFELVSTSANPESTSRELLHELAAALGVLGAGYHVTDAASFPLSLAGVGEPAIEYVELIDRIRGADGVAFAFGIHGYSTPGLTKNLVDVIGSALVAKPVAFVTAAGSIRSHLAPSDLAVSIVQENGSFWFPTTVQVTSRVASESPEERAERLRRIEDLASGFVRFTASLRNSVV